MWFVLTLIWLVVSLTYCGLIMPYGVIDLCQYFSGNGLLPLSTKPLSKIMLACHHVGHVVVTSWQFNMILVRSWRWVCLVTWFCYHLIAKLGNKTGAPSWPNTICLLKISITKVPQFKTFRITAMFLWISHVHVLHKSSADFRLTPS